MYINYTVKTVTFSNITKNCSNFLKYFYYATFHNILYKSKGQLETI